MFTLFEQEITWYHPFVFIFIAFLILNFYDIFLLVKIQNLVNDEQPRPVNDEQPRPTNDQQTQPTNVQQNRPTNAQQPRPTGHQQVRPNNNPQSQPTRDNPQATNPPNQGGNASAGRPENTTTTPVDQPTLPIFPQEQIKTNTVNDARGPVHNRLLDAVIRRYREERNRTLNSNPKQNDFGQRPHDNTLYANLHEYTFPPREDPAGQQATENINTFYQEQYEMFPFKFNNLKIQKAIECIATFIQLLNLPMLGCLRSPLASHQDERAMSKSIINELFSLERVNRLLPILNYLSDPNTLAADADIVSESIVTLTIFASGLPLEPQPGSPFLQISSLLRGDLKCRNARFIYDYILICLNDPAVTSAIMNNSLPMEEARLNDQNQSYTAPTITNAPFMKPLVQTPQRQSRFAMPHTRFNAQRSSRETPETESFKANVDLHIREMNRIMTDFFNTVNPNYVPPSPSRPSSDNDSILSPSLFTSPMQASNPDGVVETVNVGTQTPPETINRSTQTSPQRPRYRGIQATRTNRNPPPGLPTFVESVYFEEERHQPGITPQNPGLPLLDFTQDFQHPSFAQQPPTRRKSLPFVHPSRRNAPDNISRGTSNQDRNPAASSNTRQATLTRTSQEEIQAGPSNTQGKNQTGSSNTQENNQTGSSNTEENSQLDPLAQATVLDNTSQVNHPESLPIAEGPPSKYFRRRRPAVFEGSNTPAPNISHTRANSTRGNRAPGPRGLLSFNPFKSPNILGSTEQSQTGQTQTGQTQVAQPPVAQPPVAQPPVAQPHSARVRPTQPQSVRTVAQAQAACIQSTQPQSIRSVAQNKSVQSQPVRLHPDQTLAQPQLAQALNPTSRASENPAVLTEVEEVTNTGQEYDPSLAWQPQPNYFSIPQNYAPPATQRAEISAASGQTVPTITVAEQSESNEPAPPMTKFLRPNELHPMLVANFVELKNAAPVQFDQDLMAYSDDNEESTLYTQEPDSDPYDVVDLNEPITRDVNFSGANFSRAPPLLIDIDDENDFPAGGEAQTTTRSSEMPDNETQEHFRWIAAASSSNLIGRSEPLLSPFGKASISSFRSVPNLGVHGHRPTPAPPNTVSSSNSLNNSRNAQPLPEGQNDQPPFRFPSAPTQEAGSSSDSNNQSSFHSLVPKTSDEASSSNNSRSQDTEKQTNQFCTFQGINIPVPVRSSQEEESLSSQGLNSSGLNQTTHDQVPPPGVVAGTHSQSTTEAAPSTTREPRRRLPTDILSLNCKFTPLQGTDFSDTFMVSEGDNTWGMPVSQSMYDEFPPGEQPQYIPPPAESLLFGEPQNIVPVTTENPVLEAQDVPAAVESPALQPQNTPVASENPVLESQNNAATPVLEQRDIGVNTENPVVEPQNIPPPASEPANFSNDEASVHDRDEFTILWYIDEDYLPLCQLLDDLAGANFDEVLRVRAVYRNFMAQVDDFFENNNIDSFNTIHALALTGNATSAVLKKLEDIQKAYEIFLHHIKNIQTFVPQYETYFVVYQNIHVLSAFYFKSNSLLTNLRFNEHLTRQNVLKVRSVMQSLVQKAFALESVYRSYKLNTFALHPNNVTRNLDEDVDRMVRYCYYLADTFKIAFEHVWCFPLNPLPHMLYLPNELELNQEDGSNMYRTRSDANTYNADHV